MPETHTNPTPTYGSPNDSDATCTGPSQTVPYQGPAQAATPPGFEVLAEVGRGGMGVVYKARQIGLNRVVALKVISGGGDGAARLRFLAEAEAVAAVDHPHVVRLFEYGEAAGGPYLAMEYLSGGTLAGRLQAGVPLDESVQLVAAVAAGVAAAHAAGIIHRDLKPSNVLFDEKGEPKVADFGLAKRAAGGDLTRSQVLLGTPAYMAPEQAAGRAKYVGPQADVWAVGVILYECLTGRRPFAGDSREELLAQVLNATPTPPKTVTPRVPRDLERVCLKCLAKDPADRYPTAAELTDDLNRFARGEPVSVRAAGPAERVVKWARRNPAVATSAVLGVVAVALTVVAAVLGVAWDEAATQRRQTQELNAELVAANNTLDEARGQLEQALDGERQAKDREASARRTVEVLNTARTVDLAHRAFRDGALTRPRAMLDACPPETRAWEWKYVDRLLNTEGRNLEGPGRVRSFRVTREGTGLVAAHENDLCLWDLASGTIRRSIRAAGVERVLGFGPDGRTVWAEVGRKPAAWDLDTGRAVPVPAKLSREWNGLTLSADGRWLLTVDAKGEGTVWDPAEGRVVRRLGPVGDVSRVSFNLPRDQVGLATPARGIAVIDLWTGKRTFEITRPKPVPGVVQIGLNTPFDRAPVFSPRGDRFLVFNDFARIVYDTSSGQKVSELALAGNMSLPTFSPNGFQIAAVVANTLRVYETTSGRESGSVPCPYHELRPPTERAYRIDVNGRQSVVDERKLVFSPDGMCIALVHDSVVHAWGYTSYPETEVQTFRHTHSLSAVAFTPDGRYLIGRGAGLLQVWELHNHRGADAGTTFYGGTYTLSISPDGRQVATDHARSELRPGGQDFVKDLEHSLVVRVRDVRTGQVVRELPKLPGYMANALAFSPDGGRLLVAPFGSRPLAWDLATGREVPTRFRLVAPATHRAFHLGRSLAAVTPGGNRVTVWDYSAVPDELPAGDNPAVLPADRRPVKVLELEASAVVSAIRFSHDGRRLVVAGADGGVKVRDLTDGREWQLPARQHGIPFHVALSPDGTRLLMRVDTGVHKPLRLWDLTTGQELLTLSEHTTRGAFDFTPDGETIYAISNHGLEAYGPGPLPPPPMPGSRERAPRPRGIVP